MLERLPLAEEAGGEGSGASLEVGQSMLPEPDRASDVVTQRRQPVFEGRADSLERRRIVRNGICGDQVAKRPQLHRREVHGWMVWAPTDMATHVRRHLAARPSIDRMLRRRG